jgi:trimethylamine--corrinoid protein Co-methyltransferase
VTTINAGRRPDAESHGRLLSLRRGPTIGVLPQGGLERVVEAAFGVLQTVGVAIGARAIRDELAAAGVEVGDRARFPAALLEDALHLVPREMLFAARDPANDLAVDGTQGWLSTGGRAGTFVDHATDERRGSTEADVVTVSRLADAIPQLGFVGPSAAALDVPAGARALHELHAQVANTAKHVQLEIPVEASNAEAIVEIARAVAGGEETLRARPVVSALLPTRSPLAFEDGGLEVALSLARAGVPCGFVAQPVAGTSVPVTLAGALVSACAEVLAGIATLELLVPGAPTSFGTRPLLAPGAGGEPAPGGSHGLLFQMAWMQIARRLGLPALAGAFATGARSSDWQAGIETGLSATACWMTGPDLLAAAGARDGGREFSPVAMLLDAELFDLVRRIPLGFEVDEDALALELIEKVGPGEHFLGEPHTLRHMREFWTSRYMDTEPWEIWEEGGKPQPPQRAAERARELLDSHEPTPLPPAVDDRIREVIAEHERDHA